MIRYYIVPNLTKANPSQDNVYRKHFSSQFSYDRDGSGLSFKGYLRATAIYGGEQRLINQIKSYRKSSIDFCDKSPASI
ncbi:hypothetical protein LY76DRAFT_596727 [Colletotrichum caudatum]|nr:hypothetical protein LY76DRAFT_596727 [Colletotrichum caudatum]